MVTDTTSELDELIEKYGQRNVEQAMIHITELRDAKDLHIMMRATAEKARRVLEVCFDEGPRYLIWSFEHRGWWGPAHIGYYPDRADAGIYSEREAMFIVARANIITINEALVPITHALGVDIIPGGKGAVPE
jgi:hypothetical protein